MLVYIPFVPGKLSQQTLLSLDKAGHSYELCDVSASDTSYYELLSSLWEQADEFCIIEHDIVVNPNTIDLFYSCPSPWCGSLYPYLHSKYAGLGCTRFRPEVMKALPDLMVEVGEMSNPLHAAKHWCIQDHFIQMLLRQSGYQIHVHMEDVVDHVGSVADRPKWPTHNCCGEAPGESNGS